MTIPTSSLTLDEINGMSSAAFVRNLGGVFENSPWVAEGAYHHIPFRSGEHLHSVMMETARSAEEKQWKALLRAHPDLATRLEVSPLSAEEQQGAGLNQLTPEEFIVLQDLNEKYTEKFNFPFILAVRGKNKDDIISAIRERVQRSQQEETVQALSEISVITRFRLQDMIQPFI
jgi:2-oxo-4-hydroxy-4-carboxy-5-ureidoimidazoline decarboxylase